MAPPLSSLALNCTLKRSSGEPSSTDVLLDLIDDELRSFEVTTDRIRIADHQVLPGVTSDAGDGDEWPAIRQRVLDADLVVLATPIWLGHPSSLAQRVLERMDAFLGETDDQGRLVSIPAVAMVAVVGNEDGAHHVGAELFQGLNDVGFTIAAEGMTYWVGEAMQGVDFKDLDEPPEPVVTSTRTMVRYAVHLAGLLRTSTYPGS